MSVKDRGFGTMSRLDVAKHQELSSRGGKASVPKGFALLSKERQEEISRKAVDARRAQRARLAEDKARMGEVKPT